VTDSTRRAVQALAILVCVTLVGCGGSRTTGMETGEDGNPAGAGENPAGASRERSGVQPAAPVRIFERIREPREGAFSMLIPQGWMVEGGVFRVDPTAAGGPAQSIEAKLDMAVKRDAAGTVMSRALPDMRYIDMRFSPAGQMGLFPPGSNYSGMLVAVFPGAADFTVRMAFPYAHPQAANVSVTHTAPAPELARRFQQSLASLPLPLPPSCDAAVVAFAYDEGGIRYKEIWSAVLVNWGQMAAGMWENRETRFMRTPEAEFDAWVPTFAAMQASLQVNPQWLIGEIRGQAARSRTVIEVQQDIQRIEREIVENRQRMNSEIQNSMYLNLTGQEDYRNPFTGEYETRPLELGKYRWVNDLGQEIYADRDTYDPNKDINVYHHNFRRSELRK